MMPHNRLSVALQECRFWPFSEVADVRHESEMRGITDMARADSKLIA